jgi:hypothetical protein
MDIRYMGFEQQKNARAYRFDVVVKGVPNKRCVVTADLALFLRNRVALQEGPTLSANKLSSDLENNHEGEHELTDQDLRLHTEARLQAEATRAEKRGGRRPPAATPGAQQQRSHWRNFGL